MSFDNYYPKRKDHRKPYYRSKVFDRTCRNHGSCPYCEDGRLFINKRREPIIEKGPHGEVYSKAEKDE